MPFGGNDWLALTPEPPLEPEIPICDPHHHFWDFRTERIPYQRYLLHDLADDMNSGHNVRSTVFVEARSMYRADAPEELRPVGEVEFVQGLAAASASLFFTAGAAVGSGLRESLGLHRALSACRNTRRIGKAQMIHNHYQPVMEVDPQTYEVRADGELLVCEPASVLPLAQRYFLF